MALREVPAIPIVFEVRHSMKVVLSSVALCAALLIGATATAAAATRVIKLVEVGGSGEMGRAVLTDTPAGEPVVRVTISITGETPSEIQPSHIHKGTCGSNGPILRPLHNVVNGKSVTLVPGFTVAQLHAMHTYINIHKSPALLGTIVACGNI